MFRSKHYLIKHSAAERRLPRSFRWILIKFDLCLHIAGGYRSCWNETAFPKAYPTEKKGTSNLTYQLHSVGYFRSFQRGNALPAKLGKLEIRFRDYEAYLDRLRNGYCSLKCYEIARASWSTRRTHARTRRRMLERKGEGDREVEAARDDGRGGERKHGAIEQLYRSRSGPRRLGPRMAHFHLGLPLAHNHPPLSLSAKISKNTGISLYSNGERRGESLSTA